MGSINFSEPQATFLLAVDLSKQHLNKFRERWDSNPGQLGQRHLCAMPAPYLLQRCVCGVHVVRGALVVGDAVKDERKFAGDRLVVAESRQAAVLTVRIESQGICDGKKRGLILLRTKRRRNSKTSKF